MNSYCVGLDHTGLVRGPGLNRDLPLVTRGGVPKPACPGLGLRVRGGGAFNPPLRLVCEPAARSPSQSSQSLGRGGGAEQRRVWWAGQKQGRLRGW